MWGFFVSALSLALTMTLSSNTSPVWELSLISALSLVLATFLVSTLPLCHLSVGESRIVLRRGHVGHNFYFVYSGSLFVNVQDTDSEGNPFIKTEAILGRGDSFGVSIQSIMDVLLGGGRFIRLLFCRCHNERYFHWCHCTRRLSSPGLGINSTCSGSYSEKRFFSCVMRVRYEAIDSSGISCEENIWCLLVLNYNRHPVPPLPHPY